MPPPDAPPDAAVARFRRDLADALGRSPDGPLALAVSGGPDSMAMLALAHAALPGRILAATVDHRLRAESADEAAMVARWCHAAGVPHATLPVPAPPPAAAVPAWAREWRYALLERWAVDDRRSVLLTAHHADDQAETLLMRLGRGAGIPGLSGIRARREGGVCPPLVVVRPLLGWRRAELRGVADTAGVPYVDDPSNRDPRFTRSQARALLAEHRWLDPANLSATAAHAAEAEGALDAWAVRCWQERRGDTAPPDVVLEVAELPRAIRRRLVHRAVGSVRADATTCEGRWSAASDVSPLLDALEGGGTATLAGVLGSARGTRWRFRPAPPRRSG